jgi:hypothetical protein
MSIRTIASMRMRGAVIESTSADGLEANPWGTPGSVWV